VNAVLLCAGFGTRLHPLTRDFPKPLLPVRGRPLVEYLVDQIVATGRVERIVVVTNGRFRAHFDEWRSWIAARHPGLELVLVDDGATSDAERLGAVRDLALAIDRTALNGPLLVAAGDNLFRFSFSELFDDYASRPRSLILTSREPDLARRRRSGIAEVGEDGRVRRMWEKPAEPPTELCCPPVYLLENDALAELPRFLAECPDADAPGTFIAWLVARSPVYAHEMRGRRLDVGDVESYRRAEAWLAAAD
jgi:glucose-1-phosphate thymidylyltransferase